MRKTIRLVLPALSLISVLLLTPRAAFQQNADRLAGETPKTVLVPHYAAATGCHAHLTLHVATCTPFFAHATVRSLNSGRAPIAANGLEAQEFKKIAVAETPQPAQTPQPTAQPKILGVPVILVDRATGAGKTLVNFRNDSDKPLAVLLAVGPLLQVGNAKTSDVPVTFAAENDHGAGKPSHAFSIQPGAMVRVQAIVSHAWDAGQFEADIENKGSKIGKLKVLSFPINVKLDGATPDKADLTLVDGTPARIYLKNDDPISYALSYRLVVDERQIAASDFMIGPNGTVMLEFLPSTPIEWYNPQWYLVRFQDLFKAAAREDNVLLLYLRQPNRPTDLSSPIKKFPVKASLNFFSPGTRETLSYIIIVIVLTLGGILSLVLSHLLPNRLQRLNIMEQLQALARTTSNLSSHVGSRLGVLVRVERSRLFDLLMSRSTISPDFLNILTQCNQGVVKLSARVAMLQQMDLVMQQLADLVPLGVPPSQVDQIEANLNKATIFLGKNEPTDADLQAAQAAITEAANGVNALKRPNVTFGQELAQRVHTLVTDIGASFATRPTFVRVTARVPGPYAVVRAIPTAAVTIDASQYTPVDMAIAKLQIIQEYVQLVEGTTDPAILGRLNAREPRLLGYLQLDTWEALCSARLLLREMQGDVYPDQLQQALVANPQEASIWMDPPFAYERQPLRFRVQFHSQALDTAAAREEWTTEWEFGDGLAERGWSVSHYFLLPGVSFFQPRLPKVFTVAATFQDADGRRVVDPGTGQPVRVTRNITVNPSVLSRLLGERTVTEAIRLAAVLLIAVFGLVAGAKDQLLKLDVLPGLVAVFLVGFGADTIKNLLTSR